MTNTSLTIEQRLGFYIGGTILTHVTAVFSKELMDVTTGFMSIYTGVFGNMVSAIVVWAFIVILLEIFIFN